MLPEEGRAERVDFGEVANLGIGAADVERVVLVHVARVFGQRSVGVGTRQDDQLPDAVSRAVLECALRAEQVHLVALLRVDLEMAHEG